MKRPVKNVQLRLDQVTFQSLKEYKDICGLANLSEAVEKLVWRNLPLEEENPQTELTVEENVAVPEDKVNTSKVSAPIEVLAVDDNIPMPEICHSKRVPFSLVVENTLKKMKVGSSFLITGENQRSISLGIGKKLKMTLATRQTPDFKKDKSIRVWRVA